MEIDELLDIYRYEVGTIINNNINTIKKYSPNNDKNHTIVFLYDYDKNTNINYFDNESDVC